MKSPVKDHGIYAPAERWSSLCADPAFVELLRLARVVNFLGLTFSPILIHMEDQSPRARRDRFSGFFCAAALLHEGLRTAESLGQYFRTMPQYKSGFAPLLSDLEITALRSGDLGKIRNELVFHFDRAPLEPGLAKLHEGDTLVATSPDEFKQADIYFDVVDHALLAYLCGEAATQVEVNARLQRLTEGITTLFQRFMRASHSLIIAALKEKGCYRKLVDRPSPADEAEG